MDKALFLPTMIWIMTTIWLVTRKEIYASSKAIMSSILIAYILFWWDDLYKITLSLMKIEFNDLITSLYQSLHLAVFSLFWLCPFTLLMGLLVKDIKTQNNIIRALTIFSSITIIGYLMLKWLGSTGS